MLSSWLEISHTQRLYLLISQQKIPGNIIAGVTGAVVTVAVLLIIVVVVLLLIYLQHH